MLVLHQAPLQVCWCYIKLPYGYAGVTSSCPMGMLVLHLCCSHPAKQNNSHVSCNIGHEKVGRQVGKKVYFI